MSAATTHLLEREAQRVLEERLGLWQRRRAALFCLVPAALLTLKAGSDLFQWWGGASTSAIEAWGIAAAVALACIYGAGALAFRRMQPDPRRVARRFGWFLMLGCAIPVLLTMLVLVRDESVWGADYTPVLRVVSISVVAMLMVLGVHVLGSLFVALPPASAMWPIVPPWMFFALCILAQDAPLPVRLVWIALFPAAAVPGILWSVWRHQRWVDSFRIETIGGRYDSLRQSLAAARRVHESLFPRPIDDGPVRMAFDYEPMLEVGGDLLFARRFGSGRVLVVVVDVTGHEIASALAVTRIHAVLEAIAAPIGAGDVGVPEPGALMARLNAFVHESLAPSCVFATAVAALVDPVADEVRWASAGHPSGLLRRSDGVLDDVGSTCPLLGALPADLFEAEEGRMPFRAGDVLVLCTDGLIEAEDRSRAPFGDAGFRRVVAAAADRADATAMAAVRAHRAGPPSDDVLVVEVRRVQVAADQPSRPKSALIGATPAHLERGAHVHGR